MAYIVEVYRQEQKRGIFYPGIAQKLGFYPLQELKKITWKILYKTVFKGVKYPYVNSPWGVTYIARGTG